MIASLPRLLQQEDVVGLDVGDRYVAVARIARGADGVIQLLNGGWVEVDPQASLRERAAAIRKLWKKYKIPTYSVCTCLRSRSLIYKPFQHSNLSPEEVEGALRLEAEEALQIPSEKFHMDWFLHGSNGQPPGAPGDQDLEGVYVAVPKSEVDNHLALLAKAGLYCVVMDVAPFALGNLFLHLAEPAEQNHTTCIVSMSEHGADMAILSRGQRVFPRTVVSLTQPWAQAVPYLVENIRDVLEYHQRKMHREPVNRLLLTGHLPNRDTLVKQVEEQFNVTIEEWQPAADLPVVHPSRNRVMKGEDHGAAILSTALGLALRKFPHAGI